ncbi:MAG: hypothetical protein ABSD88_20070, partial [Candidatus Korobacteraceae bacterium]
MFLVMLVSVVQIQGQTARHTTDNHGQRDHDGATEALALIDIPKQTPSANTRHEDPATDNKEHAVKLTGLPPVTLNPVTLTDKQKTFWDYVFDWGPWVFTFVLAIVGALQAFLLLRTWQAIKQQANIANRTLIA